MGEPQASDTRWTVRFGLFELDTKAGELRKQGKRIRLQEQPFQVLVALVQRPGEVVSREEIRQRLWPDDTFVDFDHSLNTAVNKLRDVLGDSAGSPRFVETLARRGYRFIAPVQREDATASSNLAATATSPAIPVANNAAHFHPELEVPVPPRALTRGLFALVQVMYLIFYLSALFHLPGVQDAARSFLPGWAATVIVACVMVTGGVGIPLRLYLISAVSFDHRPLGEKFRQMFPVILALDQLWAVAPFLLVPQIGLGAAFAAAAGLLYLPFSERTLIRMAYVRPPVASE